MCFFTLHVGLGVYSRACFRHAATVQVTTCTRTLPHTFNVLGNTRITRTRVEGLWCTWTKHGVWNRPADSCQIHTLNSFSSHNREKPQRIVLKWSKNAATPCLHKSSGNAQVLGAPSHPHVEMHTTAATTAAAAAAAAACMREPHQRVQLRASCSAAVFHCTSQRQVGSTSSVFSQPRRCAAA